MHTNCLPISKWGLWDDTPTSIPTAASMIWHTDWTKLGWHIQSKGWDTEKCDRHGQLLGLYWAGHHLSHTGNRERWVNTLGSFFQAWDYGETGPTGHATQHCTHVGNQQLLSHDWSKPCQSTTPHIWTSHKTGEVRGQSQWTGLQAASPTTHQQNHPAHQKQWPDDILWFDGQWPQQVEPSLHQETRHQWQWQARQCEPGNAPFSREHQSGFRIWESEQGVSQPVDMAQHGVLPTAQTWLARPSPGRYLSPGKEETTNQQIDTTESRMNLTLSKRRKGSTVFGPKWLNFGG